MESTPDSAPKNPHWWNKVGVCDFDGHTEFQRMTPEQKLIWLAQTQRFYWTARNSARLEQTSSKPQQAV